MTKTLASEHHLCSVCSLTSLLDEINDPAMYLLSLIPVNQFLHIRDYLQFLAINQGIEHTLMAVVS